MEPKPRNKAAWRSDRRRRSALEAFADCPAKYEGEYLLGVENSSGESRRGTAFHAARELYIRKLLAVRETDNPALALEALEEARVIHVLPTDEWLDVESLWWRYVERWKFPLDLYVQTESTLGHKGLSFTPDLVLVADADVLTIEDLKTSWHMPSQDMLARSFQTRFYLAQARIIYPGFARYVMVYDYVRYNTQLTVELEPSVLDDCDRQLQELTTAMDAADESGKFPAYGGSHCGFCKRRCPGVADSLATLPTRVGPKKDSLLKIIQAHAILQRQADQLYDALKAAAKAEGPLRAAGVEWSYRSRSRKLYPLLPVAKALVDAEVVDIPLFVSASNLAPALERNRHKLELRNAIDALAVTKVETVFGQTKDVNPKAEAE